MFRGQNTSSQKQEVQEHIRVLQAQISELEAQEKELDDQKSWLEENIKLLNCDPVNNAYPLIVIIIYLTCFRIVFSTSSCL